MDINEVGCLLSFFKKEFVSGTIAGILIAIGGTVFLSCHDKIVGSFLFSIALLCICLEDFSLYTGKICYLPESTNTDGVKVLPICLLSNVVSTFLCALLLKFTHVSLNKAANLLCVAKLDKSISQVFLDAFFCGILIHLAVDIYKNKNSLVGILVGIPVFILCGFEHCIADVFYFSLCDFTIFIRSVVFLFVTVFGNSLGGIFIPLTKKLSA